MPLLSQLRHVNSFTQSKIFKPNLTPRIVCEWHPPLINFRSNLWHFGQTAQILNWCLQFCGLLMDFAFPKAIIFNKCFLCSTLIPLHPYLMPSGSYSKGSMVIVSIMLSTLLNTLILWYLAAHSIRLLSEKSNPPTSHRARAFIRPGEPFWILFITQFSRKSR